MKHVRNNRPLELRLSRTWWMIAIGLGVLSFGVFFPLMLLTRRWHLARIDDDGATLRNGKHYRWAEATGLALTFDPATRELKPDFPAVVSFGKTKLTFQPFLIEPREEFESRMLAILRRNPSADFRHGAQGVAGA